MNTPTYPSQVVFPLPILRRACELAARGYNDHRHPDLPPLVYNRPAPSFVVCGERPLVRSVGVCAATRFGTVGLSCYIDDLGAFVYPA